MSKSGMQLTHDMIKFYSDRASQPVYVTRARVSEKLSEIPEIRVEFTCESRDLDVSAMLGTAMRLEIGTGEFDGSAYPAKRKFSGTCVSIQTLGHTQGFAAYGVVIRPWLWFLSKAKNNTVFPEMTAPDIIKKVMSDAGFTDIDDRLSGSFRTRHYTAQYNETNFAFISRLMEEEGIYYFWDYSGAVEKMVLANSPGSHKDAEGKNEFQFDPRINAKAKDRDEVWDWATEQSVSSGKMKMIDYDMTKPNASLLVEAAIPKGNHSHKNYVTYEMQGHYTEAADGENYARIKMEREAQTSSGVTGQGNARTIAAGSKIKLAGHSINPDLEAMVRATTYFFDAETPDTNDGYKKFTKDVSKLDMPDMKGPVHTNFSVQPASEPYRPPAVTPLPDVSGLHVAIVVGPDGDEIYTDEYGRIKVMFPWMLGADDVTFWVRVVSPWAGQGYGFYGIPRIGQEVVIQFERNHPDYPICTGMLYNAVSTNPLTLPGAMTRQGIKTKSTKGGAKDAFHELTFEDLKGEELITFQSEKDYKQIIKNNATITIGMEKADAGDLHQTIKNSKFEFIKEGDHNLTVDKGNHNQWIKKGDHLMEVQTGTHTVKVKKDQALTVEGKSTTVVTGNTSMTVKDGTHTFKVKKDAKTILDAKSTTTVKGDTTVNVKEGKLVTNVKKGNRKTQVFKGNDELIVSKGDASIKATKGKVTINAKTEILLKVGSTTVKISKKGVDINGSVVTVKGKKIDLNAQGIATVNGKVAKYTADTMLTLKGSITKIN
jgi:type VI secretion system secreted protein VgrG